MYHERLANESTLRTARQVLDLLADLPPEQQQALAGPIHEAIRDGIHDYAHSLQTITRQLHPLRSGGGRGA